jgi:hypothetical protein
LVVDGGVDLDRWEFVYPNLFAVPTFGALLNQLPSQALSWAVLALAFQNGFFGRLYLRGNLKLDIPTGTRIFRASVPNCLVEPLIAREEYASCEDQG